MWGGRSLLNVSWRCLHWKKNVFLIYKEIHMRAVAKSYVRKGFLIYEEMHRYLVIYEEAISHKCLCNRSLLDFLIHEENFVFFFISVRYLKILDIIYNTKFCFHIEIFWAQAIRFCFDIEAFWTRLKLKGVKHYDSIWQFKFLPNKKTFTSKLKPSGVLDLYQNILLHIEAFWVKAKCSLLQIKNMLSDNMATFQNESKCSRFLSILDLFIEMVVLLLRCWHY